MEQNEKSFGIECAAPVTQAHSEQAARLTQLPVSRWALARAITSAEQAANHAHNAVTKCQRDLEALARDLGTEYERLCELRDRHEQATKLVRELRACAEQGDRT